MKEVTLQELLEAGCHFGHQAKKWNPKMKPYLFDVREGVHIFDLVKTKEGLEQAVEFVQNFVKAGKTILLVGTKRQAEAVITQAGKDTGMPTVTDRWLGGTLTNWEQMTKSTRKLAEMKQARDRGDYKKYTKKERLLLDREITRLERIFGGISGLTQLPDALFIIDPKKEYTAVKEANTLGIPVVALTDSNCDPDLVKVVIPANDDGAKSVQLVIEMIASAIKSAQGKPQEIVKTDKPKTKTKSVPKSAIIEEAS